MMDVGRHPKIELLTYSDIEEVKGYIGNFKVKVRKKARYVDTEKCTACEECVKVCPVVKPDEHQLGLATRKAIYIPFAQAVPSSFLINMDDCLGNNPIACGECAKVCDPKCIDYDEKDTFVDLDVGVVVVATGMDVYDPTEMDDFHYTKYENVLTSWEFEILTGPCYVTQSELLRPTDRKHPKSIGFIQCVGSRSEHHGHSYCSNICCMNTIKDSLYLKDHHPEMDCLVFYMDIRTFGKQYEELYKRSKTAGVKFIRGIPGDIVEDPKTKNLIVTVENTTTGRLEKYELDMLVLSIGVIPRPETDRVQRLLALSKSPDGFLMESHYQLNPIDSPTGGVFLAGCCESPKDIKASVIQASGAAARAERLLAQGKVKVEAITSRIDPDLCTACGLCVRVCPYGAIKFDKKAKTPPVVIEAACKGCGTCGPECRFGAITMRHFRDEQIIAMIDTMLSEKPEEKICAFACNWCSYAGADLAGLSRMRYPANARLIRTMCSGRVDEKFIWHAFRKGAPVVLVSGCHFADCHYIDANRWTQRRIERLWDKMDKLGIRPERLQMEWCSAAEAVKWQKIMHAMEDLRQGVTKQEIQETIKILTEEAEKKKAKKKVKKKAV
jgi:heterodisulfide reductase subunit A